MVGTGSKMLPVLAVENLPRADVSSFVVRSVFAVENLPRADVSSFVVRSGHHLSLCLVPVCHDVEPNGWKAE